MVSATQWRTMWNYEVSVKPVRPGIWRLRDGGFLVHGRAKSPRSKKRETFTKALPGATLAEAQRFRDDEMSAARDRALGRTRTRMRFSAYAAQLFEAKIAAGDLKSPKTLERWEDTLTIHLVPKFGEIYCHDLRVADLIGWRNEIAKLLNVDPELKVQYTDSRKKPRMKRVRVEPRTANGWFSILRVITAEMTTELELPRDPGLGLKDFDLSTNPTYTDEEPNSLTTEETRDFLATMQRMFPQHYAMTLLGFITGWRPSSLRPLRRVEEVDWATGQIKIRRSNALGQEIMEKTKTGRRQKVTLPKEVLDILRAHLDALPDGPMADSIYLFPSDIGGMRSRSVLDKPFAAVAKEIQLKKKITPRGMRRTFQDLARDAEVKDIVKMSISGHTTEQMVTHYSTAQQEEMRGAIGKVVSLVAAREARKAGA